MMTSVDNGCLHIMLRLLCSKRPLRLYPVYVV